MQQIESPDMAQHDRDKRASMTNPIYPKIFIATAMFGGKASAHYINSLLSLQRQCHVKNIDMVWDFVINESLITRARNVLAHQFLKSDCDVMMSIDSDIGFEPQAVFDLALMDLDIACGLYPFKTLDWQRIKQDLGAGRNLSEVMADSSPAVCNWLPSGNQNTSNVVEITEAGTGFMCIKRRVFVEMQKHVNLYRGNNIGGSTDMFHEYFATSIDPQRKVLLSEDYHFCQTWRKLGGKVYAKLDINLAHVGEYVYQNCTKYTPQSLNSTYFS
jgi:hypothetical protein